MSKAPPPIAVKLKSEMERLGSSPAELATLFGVKAPSVYDWLNFGRIAKKHLPLLAQWSGRDLQWWVNDAIAPTASYLESSGIVHGKKKKAVAGRKDADWPFSVSYRLYEEMSLKNKRTLNQLVKIFVLNNAEVRN